MANPAIRLEEIQGEMLELLKEAESIVRKSDNMHCKQASKAYWIAVQ